MQGGMERNEGVVDDIVACFCERCQNCSLWVKKVLVYPSLSTAPMPCADMPEDVKTDFMEAREVFDLSPKSAAALLRLALQKLMPHLSEEGKNINEDIGRLVKKGLPLQVQQALDVVRVVGNNAVHPGQIDLDDKKETASKLFGLLNFIVERQITHTKQLGELYQALPPNQLDQIEKRDGKK